MEVNVSARPSLRSLGRWLISDWVIETEAQAARLSREAWGIGAWLAMNGATIWTYHRGSVIGIPLVVVTMLRDRGDAPRWFIASVVAVAAFLTAVRWSNGSSEWTNGIAEFNIMLTLFTARCALAQIALRQLAPKGREIAETFA
jgi:hypothetical protein